jgi:hypothetical protein
MIVSQATLDQIRIGLRQADRTSQHDGTIDLVRRYSDLCAGGRTSTSKILGLWPAETNRGASATRLRSRVNAAAVRVGIPFRLRATTRWAWVEVSDG